MKVKRSAAVSAGPAAEMFASQRHILTCCGWSATQPRSVRSFARCRVSMRKIVFGQFSSPLGVRGLQPRLISLSFLRTKFNIMDILISEDLQSPALDKLAKQFPARRDAKLWEDPARLQAEIKDAR